MSDGGNGMTNFTMSTSSELLPEFDAPDDLPMTFQSNQMISRLMWSSMLSLNSLSQKFDDQSGALTLQDQQHGSVSPSVKRPAPLTSMDDFRAQIRFRPTPRVTGPVSTSVPVTTSIPEFGLFLHALRSGDSVPG